MSLSSFIWAFSPSVRDIFERFDFYTQIDRLAKCGLLYQIAEKFTGFDLHPDTAHPQGTGPVCGERLHVHGGRVVEALLRFAQQEGLRVDSGTPPGGIFRQYGFLGLVQHAVHTAQHGERQNDFAVFRLLVVAAEQIGNRPG